MSVAGTYRGAHDIDGAKKVLSDLIARAFGDDDHWIGDRRAMRLEAPIESVDLLAWLRLQGNMSRGYWAGRDGEFTIAGRGTADVLTAEAETDYEELFTKLRAAIAGVHPNLRYYGGMRFNPRSPADDQWKPFGAYRFVLPRFEVLNRGQQTYLACNAVVDGDTDIAALRDELLDELSAMPFPEESPRIEAPPTVARVDAPDRATWDTQIADALAEIEAQRFQKAVLARRTTFTFDETLDALSLFAPLSERAQRSYCFCFQPRADFAFMGATPERLYKRQGPYVQSEALAATRPRGATPEEDARLAQELLDSDKDQREHAFVADTLEGNLRERCKVIHRDPSPRVLALGHVQHLYTTFDGVLDTTEGVDADLLRTLYPSPAVGGVPRREAVDWIARTEQFDRGWYAGPVGWISADAADFAVGIRSGVVDGKSLSLYAGVGVVAGSQADKEWKETEQKIGQFLAILTQP